jgi:hypothetical protein
MSILSTLPPNGRSMPLNYGTYLAYFREGPGSGFGPGKRDPDPDKSIPDPIHNTRVLNTIVAHGYVIKFLLFSRGNRAFHCGYCNIYEDRNTGRWSRVGAATAQVCLVFISRIRKLHNAYLIKVSSREGRVQSSFTEQGCHRYHT